MTGKLKVYCDGGCRNNQSRTNIGAYAFAVLDEQDEFLAMSSTPARDTTNNIMEITACIEALKFISAYYCPGHIDVEIYSDSAYLINGMNDWIHGWLKNGWRNSQKKPVLNKDLWVELSRQTLPFNDVKFIKVEGHSGNEWNEKVDKELNEAMDRGME